ncbi:MAG: hypothetical protein AAB390_02825 [Patescibacteria group bacterium]
MSKSYSVLVIGLLVVSIGSAGVFFVKYRESQSNLARNVALLQESNRINEIAKFNKMFIDRVLINKKQVSFEERLELENAVRGLNDPDILNQWNRFVESPDETAAQGEVKKLLAVLVDKINKK